MAVLSPNRIAWTYASDDGNTYVLAAEKALTDQGNLGGAADDGTHDPKPLGMKVRRRYVSNGTVTRSVPVYATDAAMWTGTNNTISLNLNAVSTVFTQKKNRLAERTARRSVIAQST